LEVKLVVHSLMLTGYPLFCAEDEAQLVDFIVQLRGLPSIGLVKIGPRAHHFFDDDEQLSQKGKVVPELTSLMEVTKVKDPKFLALIDGCLQWLPEERMTAQQILNHMWVRRASEQSEIMS
jgi:serine/threonine protein kinase